MEENKTMTGKQEKLFWLTMVGIVVGVVLFISGCDTSDYDITEDSGIWDTDSESDASVEDASVDSGEPDKLTPVSIGIIESNYDICVTGCVMYGDAECGSYQNCCVKTFICEHVCIHDLLTDLDSIDKSWCSLETTPIWDDNMKQNVIDRVYSAYSDRGLTSDFTLESLYCTYNH